MSRVAVDPIRLEVIRNQLDGIAEEMEVALIRSAYSSIVKEGHDASTALFDANGEMIAQSTSLPAQLGLMGPAVRSILNRFPIEEIEDGDVFILNDPYDGGSHIPDVSIVAPVAAASTRCCSGDACINMRVGPGGRCAMALGRAV